MPFLTYDPFPQCLQQSPLTPLLLARVTSEEVGAIYQTLSVSEKQQVGERGLRALNLRREHGLLANVEVDEQARVGQEPRRPVEPAERLIRVVELTPERRELDRRLRRQRGRNEGAHNLTGHGRGDVTPRRSHPMTLLGAIQRTWNKNPSYSKFKPYLGITV